MHLRGSRSNAVRMPSTPLEIPVFCPASAIQAQDLGARRIELNAQGSYPDGGLTPSREDLEHVSSVVQSPNRIMIRPRGPPSDGPDFIYSDAEFEAMSTAIKDFVESGHLRKSRGDGFVFGVLRPGPGGVEVDIERNSALVEAAGGLGCTFHRAFDDLLAGLQEFDLEGRERRVERAVGDVVACGFDAVLTSGGPGRAPDNVDVLGFVVEKARDQLEVIVGGGVRSGNASGIFKALEADGGKIWAHSSCLSAGEATVDALEATALLGQLRG